MLFTINYILYYKNSYKKLLPKNVCTKVLYKGCCCATLALLQLLAVCRTH